MFLWLRTVESDRSSRDRPLSQVHSPYATLRDLPKRDLPIPHLTSPHLPYLPYLSLSPSTLTLHSTSTLANHLHVKPIIHLSSFHIHLVILSISIIMTRSHKQNDRDHAGLADGTAAPEEHLPRYFAKSGHADSDPKKTKKNGGGKGNWGVEGEEVADTGFTMTNERRRSNSSSYKSGLGDFKTKFEQIDAEPVFEEDIHGALPEDELPETSRVTTESSESGASIDEEEKVKKF